MLTFDLKSLIQDYEARTGVHLSYSEVATMTGLSVDTVKSIANRPNYNATLQVISDIASALGGNPVKYLSWNPDPLMDEDQS